MNFAGSTQAKYVREGDRLEHGEDPRGYVVVERSMNVGALGIVMFFDDNPPRGHNFDPEQNVGLVLDAPVGFKPSIVHCEEALTSW